MHPWIEANIKKEKELKDKFGLRNKKEIHIAESFLKKYKNIAKKLIANTTKQGEKEKAQILGKLQKLGLLPADATLDMILNLEAEHILNRRLQSVVHGKGLARSPKQARQFIVHRHIVVGEKEITAPSYLVSLEEESTISFKGKSALLDEDHPERANATPQEQEEKAKAKDKKKADEQDPSKNEPEAKEESKRSEEASVEQAPQEEKAEDKKEEEKPTQEPASEKQEETQEASE